MSTIVYGMGSVVAHSSTSSTYISSSLPVGTEIPVGEVRMQDTRLHCYTGSAWTPILPGIATVSLTPEAESAIEWAKRAQARQVEMEAAAANNPALRKAIDNLNLIWNIVKDDNSQ